MNLVSIDCSKIIDWESFHKVFLDEFGFPDFYGANMNAWIDCMTYLDEPKSGMTKVHVVVGQIVTLQLENIKDFKSRCPQIHDSLIECASFVNWKRIERGFEPVLALSFYS